MWNKTLKNKENEIKLARRSWAYIFLAIAFVLTAVILYRTPGQTTIYVNGNRLIAETAKTQSQRLQGLSDRESMAGNDALLFVFDESANHCLWMKDMNFNIDMVWLNEQKQVVNFYSNVSPDTYPQEFCPGSASKYAVETEAGLVKELDIKVGTYFNF